MISYFMKENKLLQISQSLAIDIIKLANNISIQEYSLADQIKRSGTSISANIAEANYPQSKLDMISKFEIALKEANETENWLIIFQQSNIIDNDIYHNIHTKLVKIKILLISSIKTLKSKL